MAAKVTAQQKQKIEMILKEGLLSIADIAAKFSLSERQVYRIQANMRSLPEQVEKKATGRCDAAKTGAISKKEIKRNVNEVLADALETKIFDAIRVYDPTAAKNDALPLAICMMADKMRLLRGESTTNVSKQEIQIVALRLLDDERRQKSDPRIVDNVIVDNLAPPEPA